MPYDNSSRLWPATHDNFFRDRMISPVRQKGPHCVSTVLAMLADSPPENFQGNINTQDPVSWSDALKPFGMKLAFCPTDVRRLRFYIEELIDLDDLFTVSYFTPRDPEALLADPDDSGWVCGSHIVIVHRDKIIDPQSGAPIDAHEHGCLTAHTKRIFRVVPATHERGL